MSVPYWVQDSVFYQIFPDRFANGNPENDPPNVKPWSDPPTLQGFHGGDLRGIIQRMDYLLDLGVNAIYLNPIFESPSTHRYNTTDYYCIDRKLGDMQDFRALLDVAHRNGMRVILDGVFNHCGRGFFAFNDILENGEQSAYKDWFHIHRFPPDAYSPGEAQDYYGWWSHKSLPKFNTKNPYVRKYILEVARYWLEQGTDGWRLDVPNEIDDDSFWEEFRHVVKTTNRDAYIVGEIWNADPRWVDAKHFDGLMNYPVRDAVLRLLSTGTLDLPRFIEKVEELLTIYPRENVQAMYVTLGSHDTERLITKVEGDTTKAKLAFLFLFAYPGAPAIYYGDEIGLPGDKDPDSRRTFPWDQNAWNLELRNWVAMLISLRKRYASLRRGDYQRLYLDNSNGHYAFARIIGDEKLIVALNANDHALEFNVPVSMLGWQEGKAVRNLIDFSTYLVEAGNIQIKLPPWSGMYIA